MKIWAQLPEQRDEIARYTMAGNILYKEELLDPYLNCLKPKESKEVL